MDNLNRAISELPSRQQILRPLAKEISNLVQNHQQRLNASRIIRPTVTSDIRVQHAVPSQREIEVVSRVFNTAELLENIIQRLPHRALSDMRATCRHFKECIDGHAICQSVFDAFKALRSHPGFTPLAFPAKGWTFFATVRKEDVDETLTQGGRDVSAEVGTMQIKTPPAVAFMLREVCTRRWEKDEVSNQPTVIHVASGVTVGQILTTIEEIMCPGWGGAWQCDRHETCEHYTGTDSQPRWDHEVQIDVIDELDWKRLGERYKSMKLFFDVPGSQEGNLEGWRQELLHELYSYFGHDPWGNMEDGSEWRGGFGWEWT